MTPRSQSNPAARKRSLPSRPLYPFTAIVGQDEMKLALLLNAIAPSIGGVLIMGHRGTGKSTAVRALARLLPPLTRVRGCVYNCDPRDEDNLCDECRTGAANRARGKTLARELVTVPVVDFPLGATEDRVCGTINIERALAEGVRAFEPGLLARANRSFLYIDEVNLLEDHLVDLLLDVSATGRNVIEREGISIDHPARFVLIGSGNPEEGELRPQLLDRFGLSVEVRTAESLGERVAIVERREAFERDPAAFMREAESAEARLRERLARAQKTIAGVEVDRSLVRFIAELCHNLKIDGHRGELTITRAVRALAAFEDRCQATAGDVRRVATMALRHRLRRDPLAQTPNGSRVEKALAELGGTREAGADQTEKTSARRADPHPAPELATHSDEQDKSGGSDDGRDYDDGDGGGDSGGGGVVPAGRGNSIANGNSASRAPHAGDNQESRIAPVDARLPEGMSEAETDSGMRAPSSGPGSRRRTGATTLAPAPPGRYARATLHKKNCPHLALDATLRAAAPWQQLRRAATAVAAASPKNFQLRPGDLRDKQFRRKRGTLFILAIDTSGSMAMNRISQAKGALANILRRSYIARDQIALIDFRETGANLLLPPCQAPARAQRILDALPVGGATPLAACLRRALEVAESAARRGAEQIRLLIFTDGRANVPADQSGAANRQSRRQKIARELDRLGAAIRHAGIASIVIDTQHPWLSGGEAQALAAALGGRCLNLPASIGREDMAEVCTTT